MKRILALLLGTLGVALAVGSLPQAQGCGSNPIVCENNLTGNPRSEWDVAGSGDATLQGFATDISINKGDTVHFKVSTTAPVFQVDIYRMGYYGGMGARKIASIANVTGRNQVPCLTDNTTFLVDCGNWTESTTWAVPTTAVSGIYFAKLTRNDSGGTSHVVFIVRDDAGTADMLFQTSDTTWQAYNQYGGFSTYLGSPRAAYKVSYNRPFSTRGQGSGYGTSNWVFYAEYPTVRWLEANGYDVSYSSGVDTERYAALVRNHKAFLSVGHDEYWSAGQRASVEAARAGGVHLAFLSGNEIFWKTRFEPSIDGANTPFRTLVTYKETLANAVIDPLDPPTWTGTWQDPRFSPPADGGRPGNALSGQMYSVNRGSAPIKVPAAYKALRFWRNTAVALLATGGVTTLAADTLGYEWDQDLDNGQRPPGLIDMSLTTVAATEYFVDFGTSVAPANVTHNLTLYRHPSGALVFGAGSVQWVWGLDPNHDTSPDTGSPTADLNIQQAQMNVFGDMGIQPQTRQPGLFPAVPSTDVAPPTSTITSPANGASILAETAVTISGTATDTGGGVVGGVEISLDGGSTWRKATGTAAWTYAWRPGTLGTTTIRTRAADDSGNIETPGAGRSVTITKAACPCSLWAASTVPWAIDSNDPIAIEVGTKFRTDLNGQITALRFYKSAKNTGTHTGHLWSAAGTLLGSVTFAGESASGWQQATLTPPVPILQDQVYVASYHTNVGRYSTDSYYFGRSGVDQWPLHAPSSAVAGGNGVYAVTPTTAFPDQSYQGNNYWVDVVIGPVDSTPPAVTITAPVNGALVGGSVSVTATATDNLNAVAGVQFKLDGVNLGAEDTVSPYAVTWNTTANSNNPHVLTAVVRDTSGNVATSAPVAVTVFNVDIYPPTVSMTSPASGATLLGNASMSATAADNNGVVGLQFLLDGAPLGAEVTAAPYTISWDTTTTLTGGHSLAARARDAANNLATSAAVPVAVANGAPVVDVTVFTDRSTASTTLVSPAFSTKSGNQLLLAFVSTDDNAVNMTVTGITGGGLTWQLVRRTNVQRGDTEIWRAFAPATLTSVSVTATLSQSAAAGLTVMSFSGVDTSGTNGSGAIGATGTGNGLTGANTATLTATRAKSWVYGVGNDYDKATARTLGANQTMIHQFLAAAGDTFWVQKATNPVSASGVSATVNDTAPTTDRWNMTIVEVMAPAPIGGISGTVSPAASGTGTTLTLTGAAGGTATADASGNFTFASLLDGAYTVTPSKAGFTFSPTSQPVTVAGATVTGVSFTATLIPTWSLSGTVSPAASGAGTTLTLSGTSSGTRTADASGNFSFTGLVDGTYTVTPAKSGFTFSPASLPLTVSGADVTAVNFTATALTWSISGAISPAATGTGTTLTLSGTSSGTATADGSGNYTFTGLTNGSYTVTPFKSGFTFSPASLPVTVANANVAAVNFTATPITYSISGAVSPAASGTGTTLALSGAASGTRTADGSGNFSFTGLANGSYTVTPSKTGFTFSPASLPVTVADASVSAANFTATPNTVSGTVSPNIGGAGTALTLSGAGSASATADASGNFTFTAVVNGSYTLTPSKSGFTFSPASQPVTVADASVAGVNFTATAIPNWSIPGTVSPAANGTGATLTLSGTASGTRTADASGNFTFTGLANGSYTVTPAKSGFTFSPASQPVTVTDADAAAINFTATPNTISGTVSPAAAGAGTTMTLTGTSSGSATADASGNFTFTGMANGSYTVTPFKSGFTFSPASQPVTVADASVSAVDFTGTAVPTWSVSGIVGPVAAGTGTTLTLSGSAIGSTAVDASGNFTFTGLANGSYIVTPVKSGFTFSPTSQPVTVANADVTAVTFTATAIPNWSISGTVSPAASGSGTTLTLSGTSSGTRTADASGNFTFTGLANGSYTVTASKSGFTFSPASQSVTVSDASVTAVTFTATPITFSISGTVSPAATGSGTTVTLSGAAGASTTADASGNFTFSGLANGGYTVTPSKSGFTFTPSNRPVTVSGANVAGITFTIQAPPTGLAIDVNLSVNQSATGVKTVTSATFSTTASNELLLAFVATDYLSGANTSVTGMTGAGLTWQLVVRANVQSGTSEIWRAFAPSVLTGASVTATLSQNAVSSLTILSFTGADTSGTNGSGAIGATAAFNRTTGAPTGTVTTTRNNSWVFGVGNDYDNAIARTVGANQTMVNQYFTPTGDTYWAQRQNSPTPLSGTVVTINDTAPTGDRSNLALCEVLPAPGS